MHSQKTEMRWEYYTEKKELYCRERNHERILISESEDFEKKYLPNSISIRVKDNKGNLSSDFYPLYLTDEEIIKIKATYC